MAIPFPTDFPMPDFGCLCQSPPGCPLSYANPATAKPNLATQTAPCSAWQIPIAGAAAETFRAGTRYLLERSGELERTAWPTR